MSEIIDLYESKVRSYCRSFPVTFDRAVGSRLHTTDGKAYVDFFAGAGALNYGHNHPRLKEALLSYIQKDGITHGLDMYTVAKERFLQSLNDVVLSPRGMKYKTMFTGPTGTNAVEAALKLARKVTGRANVVAFTNGFHGMTLGALAVTGNEVNRRGAGQLLPNVSRMPFDGYMGGELDSLGYLEAVLEDGSSGIPKPAAVILETVQAEGGVNPCSMDWLKRLAELVKRHGILLIVDDIQVGCGRTGPFFSFEETGIEPDMICLSKSLSGYGLPFAVVLLKPEHDQWLPGEHNGTFRGHNLAFVTATEALDFWRDDEITREVRRKEQIVTEHLDRIAEATGAVDRRGRGLIQGLEWTESETAGKVAHEAFARGLVVETAGFDGQVVKLLPALNIPDEDLEQGLSILEESAMAVTAGELATAGH